MLQDTADPEPKFTGDGFVISKKYDVFIFINTGWSIEIMKEGFLILANRLLIHGVTPGPAWPTSNRT